MTNTTINDMIETIEHYAQTQPDFPVYNVLGEVHTYADLKADSDSLAAKIDSLGLPAKSPVVVYGGQEYEMLATFVALTKSGHAYIPIDSHSALERVAAIVEVAEPSLIIAIADFPMEVTVPSLNYRQALRKKQLMKSLILSREMIITTSSLPLEQQENPKVFKFPMTIC